MKPLQFISHWPRRDAPSGVSSEPSGNKEEPATKLNKPTQLLDSFMCQATRTKDLAYWDVSGHIAPPH